MHAIDSADARLLAAQQLRPDEVAWLRRGELPPRLAADVKTWQATNHALTLPVQLLVGLAPSLFFALLGVAMALAPQVFSHEADTGENRGYAIFGACMALAATAWGAFSWGWLGRAMNRYRALAEKPRVSHVRGPVENVVEVPMRYGARFDATVRGVPVSFDAELAALLDPRAVYDLYFDAETRLQYLLPASGDA
ncbi:MAG: hypothetical protein U0325_33730 [Polyangiales bacterium]